MLARLLLTVGWVTWRLAKSLQQLLEETNERFPHRSKASDGTIEGSFEPARSRPDFLSRAMRLGVDTELLETLGITGVAA